MIVTEWKQLEGKTIKMVERFFLGGYLLAFEDGDSAHIDGDGEERHGAHWPILCEDDLDLVKGAVQPMQRRGEGEMTKREVQEEFLLKLLGIINSCDEDIQAVYEKRNKALTELNEWATKAWKEATDG